MQRVPIAHLDYEFDETITAQLSHNISLLNRKEGWDGFVFYALCFSQESPDTHIFPDNMTGAVFINCNLDNVFIPANNIVIGGRQAKFKVQTDLNDWEIDKGNKPIRPLNYEFFTKLGLDIPTPADLPNEKVDTPVDWPEVKKATRNK